MKRDDLVGKYNVNINSYNPPDKDWLDYLYHNTYYGGSELPITSYTVKRVKLFSKQRLALLAITLLIFIPLLAAFAGEGANFYIESTTTAISANVGEGAGTYTLRVTTSTQGAKDTGFTPTSETYTLESGWHEGNNKPTEAIPLINASTGQNKTFENITVFNQSFNDVDDNSLTKIINWYRNGHSFAKLNMPFNKNDPFTAQDYSGNAHHGTVTNDMSWNNSGIKGGCYNFNDGYIQIPDKTIINSAEGTISLWFKSYDASTDFDFLIYAGDNGNGWGAEDEFYIYVWAQRVIVDQYFDGILNFRLDSVKMPKLIANNTFYHAAFTWNNATTTSKLYIDGVEVDSNTSRGSLTVANWSNDFIRIGRHIQTNKPDRPMDGLIDEVLIFNTTLSAEQIRALYRDGVSNYDIITPSTTRVNDKWYAKVWANDAQDDSDVNTTVNLTINSGGGELTGSITLSESITCTGTCFQVKADNIIIDGNGYNLTGDNTGTAINLTNREGIIVENCNINKFTDGIITTDSNSNNLTNNIITDTTNAIILNNTNSYWLNNNTFTGNTYNFWLIDEYNTSLWGDQIENPIIESTTHGSINYTTTLTFNEKVNLDSATNFSNMEIFVNSSNYPSMNKQASLLFRNVKEFAIPRAGISTNNSKIYEECSQKKCTIPSNNSALNTVSYNVTDFTFYSILETAEEPAGTDKGGALGTPQPGGAKGLAGLLPPTRRECIIDEDCQGSQKCINYFCTKMFDIRIIRADSPIEPTDILDFTYLMQARSELEGDVILEYWLQRPDNPRKVIKGQDVIYMKAFQTKIEDASLYLAKHMIGMYELVVKLTFEGYTVESIYPVEIVAKALTALTTNLLEFNPPQFKLQIGTNKDKEIIIDLEETVKKDGKIVWQNKKQVSVKRTLTLEEQLGTLGPGTYEINIRAEADGKTSEITQTFTLDKKIKPRLENPLQIPWVKNFLVTILYSVAILGALVIIFYVGKTAARHDIVKEGRQKVRNELTGMRTKVQTWKKKGFDIRGIESAISKFKVKDLGFSQLKDVVTRAGEAAIVPIKKAGELGRETVETIGTSTVKVVKGAGELGIGALEKAKDTTIQTGGAALQAGGKAITTLESNLKNKIDYLKQKGRDTRILERKLKTFRKKKLSPPPTLPRAPRPIILQKAPKPIITPKLPTTLPKAPKPIMPKPVVLPTKPVIRPKPIVKPIPKKIVSKPKPAVNVRELEHKLTKWKKLGYDTRILEKKLGRAEKKHKTTLALAPKTYRPKISITERLANKLQNKIQEWKAKGYDTTILEAKLKNTEKTKVKSYKPKRKSMLLSSKKEHNVLSKIAEWKAKGYDTKILERQLTSKEELEVKVGTIKDKIKLWKERGYDTTILEQKLKLLKRK